MVNANKAWSPKEAVRRVFAYHDAGFDIFWIEDPCLRDDFAGLAHVAQEVTFAYINSGEYLDLRGKHLLLEHDCPQKDMLQSLHPSARGLDVNSGSASRSMV